MPGDISYVKIADYQSRIFLFSFGDEEKQTKENSCHYFLASFSYSVDGDNFIVQDDAYVKEKPK